MISTCRVKKWCFNYQIVVDTTKLLDYFYNSQDIPNYQKYILCHFFNNSRKDNSYNKKFSSVAWQSIPVVWQCQAMPGLRYATTLRLYCSSITCTHLLDTIRIKFSPSDLNFLFKAVHYALRSIGTAVFGTHHVMLWIANCFPIYLLYFFYICPDCFLQQMCPCHCPVYIHTNWSFEHLLLIQNFFWNRHWNSIYFVFSI